MTNEEWEKRLDRDIGRSILAGIFIGCIILALIYEAAHVCVS